MTFSCTPDGVPLGGAVRGLDEHPGDRAGALAALEDAHLVVDQLERAPARGRSARRASRSALSRAFTGPLPSPVAMIRSPPACTLTVASLTTVPSVRCSTMARHDSTVKCRLREPSTSSRSSSSNDASAASNVQPRASRSLTLVDHPAERVPVVAEVVAELAALQLDRGPPGHVGDEHPHVVAHQRRVDVLVEHRVHLDGAGVQAGLVRERRQAHVRLVLVGRHVGRPRTPRARCGSCRPARPSGHDGEALLQLQVGDHAEQVRRCPSARRSRWRCPARA